MLGRELIPPVPTQWGLTTNHLKARRHTTALVTSSVYASNLDLPQAHALSSLTSTWAGIAS